MSSSSSLPRAARESQEQEWLARLRHGDERACEAIYRAYHDRLSDHAYRYVRSMAVAEEIVQDVFAAIWYGREALDVRSGLNAYLFGAVRNRALRIRLREAAEHRVVGEQRNELSGITVSGNVSLPPDEALEAADFEFAVDQTLAQLPGRAAHILLLRWKYAMTYAEIADALGLSAEAAQKQGRRALDRFRALFDSLRRRIEEDRR